MFKNNQIIADSLGNIHFYEHFCSKYCDETVSGGTKPGSGGNKKQDEYRGCQNKIYW